MRRAWKRLWRDRHLGGRGAATLLVVAVLVPTAAESSASAARLGDAKPTDPYVALGDSYTVGWEDNETPTKGFVGPLFGTYRSSLGASGILNTAKPGESSATMISDGQLASALADINAPSDTRAVTVEIGGADALLGSSCPGHWDDPGQCSFRSNFASILSQIQAALSKDPGSESLVTTTYPNPSAGTGTATEASRDNALLGANGKVGCSDAGSDMGLNDAIFQEAGKLGVPVANPYPAFEQHGQAYMSANDPLHLHPNDAGYAAIADAFRHPTTACGSKPDRQPPDTAITRGPVSGTTHDSTPSFTFRSTESHSTFRCALDGKRFKRCGAKYTTPKLSEGRHTVDVAAKDAAGNLDPAPAHAGFKVSAH